MEKQKAEIVLFINDSMFLVWVLPPESFGFSATDLTLNLFYCFLWEGEIRRKNLKEKYFNFNKMHPRRALVKYVTS